jgi:outer membrane receptor protein involved in Fe transport
MKFKFSLIGLVGFALAANAEDLQTGKINVFSPGPLPSIGINQNIIPGFVQVIKSQDISEQPGVSLSDYLVNNAQGFSITEVGGNPWQPDLQFRGYSAGSIAGNPIGLSVYVDGVRENQPFSDVMLWDTVPMWAMSGTQVVAGSNPIYGLNTLGGALALQTKNGKLFNKGTISATAGSWDRTSGLIEYGGVLEDSNIDYYFGYNHTSENGWRDYSPSHLNQAFAKLGKDFENGRVEISYTGAHNNLIGNGLVPGFLMGADNSGINTVPDLTENRYHKLNLGITQFIDETTMFSANAYYVSSNRYTLNGDLEFEVDDGEMDYNEGGIGASAPEGEIRTTKTKQDKYGVSAQLTLSDDLFGKKNHLVMGSVLETSLIGFKQGEYEGELLDNRRIIVDDPAYDAATYLSGRTKTFGVYAVDTLSLNEHWHVTGGLRYNYTQVDNSDRLNGNAAAETLTAKQGWGRINPTIGVTYKPNDNYSTYVNYSESNRAPTSIELGCSNPAAPCTLPTQMADDPPLRDVVAKTYEVGARGQLANELTWNISMYHSYNHDDLQFISTSATNGMGYFDNVGRTRRDGIDVGLAGKGLFSLIHLSGLSWNASYGFVHATFDSDLEMAQEVNTSAVGDNINIKKGDLLTNIPMHRLKLRLNYEVNDKFRVGTNLVGFSKSYMLGNENQKHNGDGEIPGYFILNMDANYKVAPKWNLAFKAINLLDHDYYTGGRLLNNAFTGNGAELRAHGDAAYSGSGYLPGSPRAGWVTLSYDFK